MKTTSNIFFLLAFFFAVTFSGVNAQEVNIINENTTTVELKKEVVQVVANEEVSETSISLVNKMKSSFEITPMSKKETLMISGNSTRTYLMRTINKKASRYIIAVA